MKNKTFKIIVSVFVFIYIVLSIYTMFNTQDFADKIPTYHRVIIFINLLLSIILVVFLAIKLSNILNRREEQDSVIILPDEENKQKEDKVKAKNKAKNDQLLKDKAVNKLSANTDNINDIGDFANKILSNIADEYDIMQALFFVRSPNENTYKKAGSYAFFREKEIKEFTDNMGLTGQVAASRKLLNISNIPDDYIKVLSGLGKASPTNLLILPVIFNDQSIGVIELASFQKFDSHAEDILMTFLTTVADKLHNNYFAEVPQE